MKILLIGGAGQLGHDVIAALRGHDVSAPAHEVADLTHPKTLSDYLGALRPNVVINTAAFHDVPRCQAEPERAFAVNATGVMHLAAACQKQGARLFHISTDYVFDGNKGAPYNEQDVPAPLMVYGAAKLAGEHLALAACENTTIIRTTGLFGHRPCRAKAGGRNFVELMLHLCITRGRVDVVSDQFSCPTYTVDLAAQIKTMIENECTPGVYHAVNPSNVSWYTFAKLIFERTGLDVELSPVSSGAFPAPFKRPADSRLATTKLADMGLMNLRPLDAALDAYLAATEPTRKTG